MGLFFSSSGRKPVTHHRAAELAENEKILSKTRILRQPIDEAEQLTRDRNDAPPRVILLLSFGAYIGFEAVQSALVESDETTAGSVQIGN